MRQFRAIFVVLDRNCLASTLDYIVMQMRKTNNEKGYFRVGLVVAILFLVTCIKKIEYSLNSQALNHDQV